MAELAKPILGSGWKAWAEARYREVDQVEKLLGALMRLKAPQPDFEPTINRAIDYFRIRTSEICRPRY